MARETYICKGCVYYKANYGIHCFNGWSNDGSSGDCLLEPKPTKRKADDIGCRHHSKKTDIMEALTESVKLQSHYAKLLNMHDEGERMIFNSIDEWLERLNKTKQSNQ